MPGPCLRVGVVDDDPAFLDLLTMLVREAGGEPVPFVRAEDLLDAAAASALDAVLTDYCVPLASNGEAIVRACKARAPALPVAVISVVDSASAALALLRLGADDYLLKQTEATELVEQVRVFLQRAEFSREVEALERALSPPSSAAATHVLAASPSLRPLLEILPRAARSGANVLVSGESGTGKELAARAVHELSRRAAGPFVAVDCGAIPEALLENELFGHRKGAFSDAREDREGLVQRAHGGTLFLDEIGELPLTMQAKLLRFLQTREYRRLGDPKVSVADVRVVAATHRDLRRATQEGAFRQDLYFRLNVIELRVPPLRDRREDIPLLATAFLRRFAAEFESPAMTFSQAALDALQERDWEGNVRELENAVQRAVALATTPVVDRAQVEGPATAAPPQASAQLPAAVEAADTDTYHVAKQRIVDAFEREYATRLVTRHGGNLTAAAREAGLDRKSLSRLLARHGMSVSDLVSSGDEPDAADAR